MPRDRSSRRGPAPALLAALGAVLILAAGAFWWLTQEEDAAHDDVSPPVVQLPEGPTAAPEPEPLPDPYDRPEPEPEPEPERPLVGTLTGRLVTADLLPVPAGEIVLLEGTSLGLPGESHLPRLAPTARVDGQGRFELTDVPAVEALTVRARGDLFAVTEAGPFALADGQTLDLGSVVVEPGMSVHGRISDPGGRAVEGAQVAFYRSLLPVEHVKPERVVLTGADGRYSIDFVSEGQFSLVVSAEGFATAGRSRGLSLDPTSHVEMNVQLEPAVTLAGELLAPAEQGGGPARDAQIVLTPIGPGRAPVIAHTDGQGRFVFPSLGQGGYQLTTDPPGALELVLRIPDVAAAGELSLQLEKAGSLSGHVQLAGGEPVRAFDLQLRRSDKLGSIGTVTGRSQRVRDAGGRFEVLDLEPGWYRVEAWSRGHAVTLGPKVMVRKGRDVDGHVVVLQAAARLRGRAVDDLGEPIAGAKVSLHTNKTARSSFLRAGQDQASWYASTRTDRDGRFELDKVTAQIYQVSVDHPAFPVGYRDDVAVTAGGVVELDDFVIDRPATLTGVVIDRVGQPVRGATVHLGGGGNRASFQVVSDAQGRYRFGRLAAGDYMVQALKQDAEPLNVLSASIQRLAQARRDEGGTLRPTFDVSLVPGQQLNLTVTADG